MAYINLEFERADVRVILERHNKPITANQLPANCTGILEEGMFVHPFMITWSLSGELDDSEYGNHHFNLIEQAKQTAIPIVSAEAPIKMASKFYTSFSHIGKQGNPRERLILIANLLCTLPVLPFFYYLSNQEEEVTRGNLLFKALSQMLETTAGLYKFSGVETLDHGSSFRNLLLAQRTHAFADFQIASGLERPSLVLVVGSAHLRVVQALEMNQEERVRNLLNSPYLNSYQDHYFHTGFFTRFDRSEEKWIRGTFEDPRLKLA